MITKSKVKTYPMSNVMIDLETLGTSAGCSIISIGAVAFDPVGQHLGAEFHVIVNRASCKAVGLFEDRKTIAWWEKQSVEAKNQTYKACSRVRGTFKLITALKAFNVFLSGQASNAKIWGNGGDFDNAILQAAYRRCDIAPIWEFWNNRCYRTLKGLYPMVPLARTGTHHNALDDAKSQADHALAIFKHMRALTAVTSR